MSDEPAMVPEGVDLWDILGAPEEAETEEWWTNCREQWLHWHARQLAGYRQQCTCFTCGASVILDEPRPFDARTTSGTPVENWKKHHACPDAGSGRPNFRTALVQVGALEKGQLATVPVES